jgi:hypothetical protein
MYILLIFDIFRIVEAIKTAGIQNMGRIYRISFVVKAEKIIKTAKLQ